MNWIDNAILMCALDNFLNNANPLPLGTSGAKVMGWEKDVERLMKLVSQGKLTEVKD